VFQSPSKNCERARMAHYFFDADAVTKLWLFEPGHDQVKALVDDSNNMILVSDFAMLEAMSALGSIYRNGEITQETYHDASAEFQALMVSLVLEERNFKFLSVNTDRIDDAIQVVREDGLRAGDALHIALALSCAGLDLTMVSGDKRVIETAEKRGLRTLNVNQCRCPKCGGLMKPNLVRAECLHCLSKKSTYEGATCEDCGYKCDQCRNPKWCQRLMMTQCTS
jgi:predicted nucleic acid-binding protein